MDPGGAGRRRAASRVALPRGSGATLAGIVVSGLSGFGALAIAGRAVEAPSRSALAATWTLVFLVGPALFFPVEQALAGRLLAGNPAATRRAAALSAWLCAGLAATAIATLPLYLHDLLDGRLALLGAVAASVAGYAAQHVLRAVLLARGDFRRYAAVLAVEGVVRVAGCAAAVAVGTHAPEPYAWVIGIAPAVATAVCAIGLRGAPPSRAGGVPGAAFGTDLTRLIVASLCANAVISAGPAVLKLLAAPSRDALVSSYLVTASLTRIPLLLGQAFLAPLLAGLAPAVAAGDLPQYRRVLAGAVTTVALAGALTTAGFAVVAPAAVPALFGRANGELGSAASAALAGSAVLFLLAQLFTQALVAQRRTRHVTVAWVAATAVAGATLALWPGVPGRVLAATAAGCLAAAAALARPAATLPPRPVTA